jgi:hypothetical protein
MGPKGTGRSAYRRAVTAGVSTAMITGTSVAAGYGQIPNLAQTLLLIWSMGLSGWVAGKAALPEGIGSASRELTRVKKMSLIWQVPIASTHQAIASF